MKMKNFDSDRGFAEITDKYWGVEYDVLFDCLGQFYYMILCMTFYMTFLDVYNRFTPCPRTAPCHLY